MAIAAIAVSIALARRARARKVLAFSSSATPVIHEKAKSTGLELSLYGEPVTEAHLVELQIGNAGNAPIRADDFESPLKVKIGIGEALDAEVVATIPDDLEPDIPPWVTGSGGFEIEPLLLNPGDGFTIHAIVRDFKGPVTLGGRIAGATFVSAETSPRDQLTEALLEGARLGFVEVTVGRGLMGTVAMELL